MLRWIWDKLGTLALAFFLALTVWIVAVNQADPIIERTFTEPIPVEIKGLPEDLLIVGEVPETAEVTIRAPESAWSQITQADIRISVDLNGKDAGTYEAPLQPKVNRKATQVTGVDPSTVIITLEQSATLSVPVEVFTIGEPALGFQAQDPVVDPREVEVIGPDSAVEKVASIQAQINVTNRQQGLDQLVSLTPVDEAGNTVGNVQIQPERARVSVDIRLRTSYRLVSVIPNIQGREELEQTGYYQVTGITVDPPDVVVRSSDVSALNALPGFVQTVPLNIVEATGDIERRMPLDLPERISLVGEQSVLVKVSIKPVQKSLTVSRAVEILNLGEGFYARTSPSEVDVILTGPSATLDALEPGDVRVVLDMIDYDVGTYQLEPQVLVLPTDVSFDDPIPATVEVIVTDEPPPTPSPSPVP
jgi:YbbR domain-containing protein